MTTLQQPALEPLTGGSSSGANVSIQVPGRRARKLLFVLLAATSLSGPVAAQEPALGADLPGLLTFARTQSPELRAMQAEADAAAQRIGPAGALPDPVLRVELMNINNYGTDASPACRGRVARMGARLQASAPPAITTSAWPLAIRLAARATASSPAQHWVSTV